MSKNGTTIEQQIKAVDGEVQSYVRSMTWHDHQKALDDAVRTLQTLSQMTPHDTEKLLNELEQLKAKVIWQFDQLETFEAQVALREVENKKLTQEAAYLKGLLDDVNDKNQRLTLEREELMKAFSEFKTGQRTARELYDLLEKYETG